MENSEKPNYYAILPAEVRYDENLSSTEKLIYAEITALSNKEGVCWARNQYFADLYNVSQDCIKKAIRNLKLNGYIQVELVYKKNSKEVLRRNIYLTEKIILGHIKNYTRGHIKNYMNNNINNNNINNNKYVKQYLLEVNKNTFNDLDELYDN